MLKDKFKQNIQGTNKEAKSPSQIETKAVSMIYQNLISPLDDPKVGTIQKIISLGHVKNKQTSNFPGAEKIAQGIYIYIS